MNLNDAQVDAFLHSLTRPMYVWRMGNGQAQRQDAMGRSAQTRQANARNEIRRLIADLCEQDHVEHVDIS